MSPGISIGTHIVGPGLLRIHPLPIPVEEGHKEQRPPEDEVGHCDHEEHLDPGDPIPLHPLDVHPDPVSGRKSPLLKNMFSVLFENCVFSKPILSQTNFILSFGENQKEKHNL